MIMIEAEITSEIIGLVPHWYRADCGPAKYSLSIGGYQDFFYNPTELTPVLDEFLKRVHERTKELDIKRFGALPSLIDVLLEALALEWFRLHYEGIDWIRLLKYLEATSRRTNEGEPVALNLIIRPGQGRGDITRPQSQKFFDQLASSAFTYLTVDPQLRLIDYGEVGWSQIHEASSHRFYPESLHPLHTVLEPGDLSAHLTAAGDLVFMNQDGLLAARRKRIWKLYDIRTFEKSLAYCIGKHNVGVNLFEVIFDLSFKRRGALLIYDPDHLTRDHVLNRESIVFSGWVGQQGVGADSGQSLIRPSVEDLPIGNGSSWLKKKRRVIELASADGAIIFDD